MIKGVLLFEVVVLIYRINSRDMVERNSTFMIVENLENKWVLLEKLNNGKLLAAEPKFSVKVVQNKKKGRRTNKPKGVRHVLYIHKKI